MATASEKSIFITGAASGIGRSTAKLFSDRGWFVGLYDLNESGLRAVQGELDNASRCVTGRMDVTDPGQWEHAVAAFTAATGGRMDVFFNNAGIVHGGMFEDIPVEASRQIIETNLVGAMYGLYACLPALKSTPGSCVVNTSSGASLGGGPMSAVYSASKFGIRGLTESLAIEFKRHGIRVCDVVPWFTDTPMLDNCQMHGATNNISFREGIVEVGEPIYSVEDVAKTVLQAVDGKKIHYLVGTRTRIVKFLADFLPGVGRRGMHQNMNKVMRQLGIK